MVQICGLLKADALGVMGDIFRGCVFCVLHRLFSERENKEQRTRILAWIEVLFRADILLLVLFFFGIDGDWGLILENCRAYVVCVLFYRWGLCWFTNFLLYLAA